MMSLLRTLGCTVALVAAFCISYTFSVSYSFAADSSLINPLNQSFSSIPNFIAGALKVLVMVALPIITLFFVYSGFLFISAQGNTEQIASARRNFFYVVIGSLLILGAWVIATLIGGTVTQLLGT